MRRQYWLSNENGKCYYLNNEEEVILYKVKGLGVETGKDFYELGNGFFRLIESNKRPQTPITGTIAFYGKQPEDKYLEFSNFVLNSEELYFNYAPSTRRYMRRVEIDFLTKDGLHLHPELKIPVAFLPLTPWYTNDVEIYSLGVVADGFRAMDETDIDGPEGELPIDDEEPLVVDGGIGLDGEVRANETEPSIGESRVWDEMTAETACEWQRLSETDVMEGGIVVQPKGQVESTFDLSFEGLAVTPTVYVIGTNTKKEYGRLVLGVSFSDGERLEYSTSKLGAYVRKVSRGKTTDLIDKIDPSYNAFPRFPTTEPSRIVVTSDGQIDGVLTVAVQRYMVGV